MHFDAELRYFAYILRKCIFITQLDFVMPNEVHRVAVGVKRATRPYYDRCYILHVIRNPIVLIFFKVFELITWFLGFRSCLTPYGSPSSQNLGILKDFCVFLGSTFHMVKLFPSSGFLGFCSGLSGLLRW